MANEIQAVAEPGLTLTATIVNGTMVQATGVPMTQVIPGFYVGSVPTATVSAGNLAVLIYDGDEIVASGELQWDGQAEISIAPLGTKIRELHLIHGLEPGQPLVVRDMQRFAGYINQTITDNGTETVVARP